MLYLGAPEELEAHLEHNSVQQETYKSIGIQIINFLALQTRFLDLPTFFFPCCPQEVYDLMKSSELVDSTDFEKLNNVRYQTL